MAQVGWTLRGRVLLRHDIQELADTYGAISPMAGIRVRVQARERIAGAWGNWKKWDDVIIHEDDDGAFQVSKIKTDRRRRFRIQVQFKDDELVVYGANRKLLRQATRGLRLGIIRGLVDELLIDELLKHISRIPYQAHWHTIHVDRMRNGRGAGIIDLGDLVFQPNGADDLGDETAYRQANIWFLYKKVIGHFAAIGRDYRFKKRVAVKYPHSNPLIGDRIEAPYANPYNQMVYLIKNTRDDDYLSIGTLLHELMHIWAYQHCRGEKNMAWQLALHRTTHGLQKKTFVAFHEGFAEWAYMAVYRRLFGKDPKTTDTSDIDAPALPLNRSYLSGAIYGLPTISEVERHEWGWVSFFYLLTTRELFRYTFGGTHKYVSKTRARPRRGLRCADPAMEFPDVLRLFLTDNAAGQARKLRQSEMNFAGILARASTLVPQFNAAARTAVLSLLDPTDTREPRDLLCR